MTGTFEGRMSKADLLPEALGTIDELNSWVGLCRAKLTIDNGQLQIELKRIQNNLLTIGSGLAGSGKKIKPYEVTHLEKLIDKLTKQLPKLANFIYPVGELQVARTVCRRAERGVVALDQKNKVTLRYLNRLSDVLFTMGRWVNQNMKIKEEVWK